MHTRAAHCCPPPQAAIAKVGEARFYGDLFMVGLLYHLYNQFAFNTLQRVSPVSHGVCNVVKRVVIIFSSVLFFNQVGWGESVGHHVHRLAAEGAAHGWLRWGWSDCLLLLRCAA